MQEARLTSNNTSGTKPEDCINMPVVDAAATAQDRNVIPVRQQSFVIADEPRRIVTEMKNLIEGLKRSGKLKHVYTQGYAKIYQKIYTRSRSD